MKHIAILGSTGSIGTQTLHVINRHTDKFCVEVLCAGSNAPLLAKQARQYNPNAIAIADESKYDYLKSELADTDIKVFCGEKAIEDLMEMQSIDIVVAAIVGFAGLKPTLRALQYGKVVALSNKEAMVVAGEIMNQTAAKNKATILPVDSEHSAIFQCLMGEISPVDKLILTASGGPFRGYTRQQLSEVTLEQALHHPNWKMGRKVTIDSATLMNKGLEVIEASRLFGIDADKIDVLVHPQSAVHSMVQFADGSIKAQIGTPTMETPIQYALTFPERYESHLPRFDWEHFHTLTFEQPDRTTFRCLDIAYNTLRKGGNAPCALNAANEVAVQKFIEGEIKFLDIPDEVERNMQIAPFIQHPTFDELIQTDNTIRFI